jgi:hypothetical protein
LLENHSERALERVLRREIEKLRGCEGGRLLRVHYRDRVCGKLWHSVGSTMPPNSLTLNKEQDI